VELPIQVTPVVGLPFFGTSIGAGGPWVAQALAWMCAREPLVNLELHLMDFLDASDGLSALLGHQPELNVPVGRRMRSLARALDLLAAHGYAFVTLADAARIPRSAPPAPAI
jgi:hypothetical protein